MRERALIHVKGHDFSHTANYAMWSVLKGHDFSRAAKPRKMIAAFSP